MVCSGNKQEITVQEFNDLYDSLYDSVRAYIIDTYDRICKSEDIAQEAFMRFWQNRDKFRGQSKPFTYLCSIAGNIILDHNKHHNKEKHLIEGIKACYEEYYDPDRDHDDTTKDQEVMDVALEKLSCIQREALEAYMEHDFSHGKAATELGCSRDQLYDRIYRAKGMMKRYMGELPNKGDV